MLSVCLQRRSVGTKYNNWMIFFLVFFFFPQKCNLTNRGTPFLDKHDDDDVDLSSLLV